MRIGVFDSGLGGLTILKELVKKLPSHDYIYLGDNARSPYGDRSFEDIIAFTRQGIDFLIEQKCEAVVIACNSASAVALPVLHDEYAKKGILIQGVIEPMIDSLIKQYPKQNLKPHKVGLIATRATVRSGAYEKALAHRNITHIALTSHACPLLVPLIEEGFARTPAARMILRSYLRPLKSLQIQSLLLACTHYPIIAGAIQSIMGTKTSIIHPGIATAEWLSRAIKESHVDQKKEGNITVYTTGDTQRFADIGTRFWKTPLKAVHITLH